MDAPKYDQISKVLDQAISRRGHDLGSIEAYITRSTLAICKLEDAADLIRRLLNDERLPDDAERAAEFLQSLTPADR